MSEYGEYNFSVTAVVYHMYAATLCSVAYNVTNIDFFYTEKWGVYLRVVLCCVFFT